MKFNSITGLDGLIQDCEILLGMTSADISGDSTLLKTFTRMINAWYRRVNSWIWEVTGAWEYDDSNWTDLPIATTNLITTSGSEQQKYVIPSDAQKIDRVEVLDADGNYQLLAPINKRQIKTSAMSEFKESPGMPQYYDLLGRVLVLYPKPKATSVTDSAGLKLYFSRDIDEFICKTGSATDTLANHLIDNTLKQFTADDLGRVVKNVTDGTFATITLVNDSTNLSLDDNIFESGEEYSIDSNDQEPGFVSNFHRILSLGASLDYCIAFMSDEVNKINSIRAEINALKKELKNFYGTRHRDFPTRISPRKRDYT